MVVNLREGVISFLAPLCAHNGAIVNERNFGRMNSEQENFNKTPTKELVRTLKNYGKNTRFFIRPPGNKGELQVRPRFHPKYRTFQMNKHQ